MKTHISSKIKDNVKLTYTAVVKSGSGCGPGCCSSEMPVSFLDESYKHVEGYQEMADYGLGCGLPTEIAGIKKGDVVLDLGSGAGNDVFIARNLVGESGKVIGVDFTEAMVKQANENRNKLGFENVAFILGDIEELPIASASVDVVISNCVMNLVPDKKRAYQEVFRVLKPGGHFSIADVVLKSDLPHGIMDAAAMYVSCIAGALKKSDYLKIIEAVGFTGLAIKKEQVIHLPDDLLMEYLSKEEIVAFKNDKNGICSISFIAFKP